MGTGELLRLAEVQKAIKEDFVVLPCDLFSELEGSKLLQQWMTLNPASPSRINSNKTNSQPRKGGLALFYPTHNQTGLSTKKDETDFLASTPCPSAIVPPPQGSLRTEIERIVTVMPTDTLNDKLEEDKGHLRVRQTLLQKHARVKLRMKWRDAHVYIFPLWVKDFVQRNEKFDSISEDLLGWWAKVGWQDGLVERLGLSEVLGAGDRKDGDDDEADEEDLDAMTLSSTKISPAVKPSAAASMTISTRVGALTKPPEHTITVPPLLAYVQPAPPVPADPTAIFTPTQPLIRRIDTPAQLAAVSLYLARQQPGSHFYAHDHKIHPSASIGIQSRIAPEDCLVAENVKLGIRCNVKESVIGAGCEIGSGVRLLKCVLMDGVVVGDGVVLTGCIVGKRARIEGTKSPQQDGEGAEDAGKKAKGKGKKRDDQDEDEKTRLTDCEIAPRFVVEAGTEAKGEKLMAFGNEELEGVDEEDGGDEDMGEDGFGESIDG